MIHENDPILPFLNMCGDKYYLLISNWGDLSNDLSRTIAVLRSDFDEEKWRSVIYFFKFELYSVLSSLDMRFYNNEDSHIVLQIWDVFDTRYTNHLVPYTIGEDTIVLNVLKPTNQ